MTKSLLLASVLAAVPIVSPAVETKTWSQGLQTDYEKATVKRLSIRSDGRITLAPAFKEVFESSMPYLWALAEDSKGHLYAGGGGAGGSKAKLYQIDKSGSNKVVAEFDALEIHAIAIDRSDNVYAATSPDGKIYRMAPGNKAQLFYDPKAKYIWAIAFDSKGNLFVATGDGGEIHKVAPDGRGSVFAKTEEVHVRSMTIDKSDNLVVGTEPGGLIVRISPAGEGFVLHQASKREVTAVAIAQDGSIYASAVGSKPQAPAPPPPSTSAPVTVMPVPAGQPQGQPAQRSAQPQPLPTLGTMAISLGGGSEIWRIASDGSPRKVWNENQETVYALAFDGQQRLLIGTGNKGNVYRLDAYPLSTLLVNSTPTQVLVFATGHNGQVHLATGNIGKVYSLGPELEKDGYLDSEVLDAGSFSYWGRLSYEGKAEGGTVAFQARSGNLDRPQKNWSPWTPIELSAKSGRIVSPASRFVQYKLTLKSGADGRSPQIDSVDVAYMSKNVAPVIEEIEVTPANYRFPAQTLTLSLTQNITLPALGRKKSSSSSSSLSLDSGGTQSMNYAKGYVGVRWLAVDENGDSMNYKVEIRGAGEKEWKLLKEKLKEKLYSWDSTVYPDGEYQVRVIVSDSPSNPPASALTGVMESDPFIVDNTPPQILDLKSALEGTGITVKWGAKDALNVLDKAEYSVDGGEWTIVEPVTKLSDSKELEYNLKLSGLARGEHTIAVRVSDAYDNQAVEKTVVK